jgi:DNA-binding transcriptional regulator YiaG
MTPAQFKEIRQQVLKLSQWHLAQGMAIRPEMVSRMERGKQVISLNMAQRLLDLAGLKQCPTCGQPLPS